MSMHLYTFKEAIPTNYVSAIPKYFRIHSATTFDVIVIRLLTSTIRIEDRKSKQIAELTHNYCAYPKQQVTRKSSKQINGLLSPFKMADYIKYSKKFYGRNIKFYNNLMHEITFYYWYSNQGQFQSAFVNLYRILEYISYSFPLLHASHQGNYIGTFEMLRGFFQDEKTSELKFFDKFVQNLFTGTPYLAMNTDFNFSSPDTIISTNAFTSFKALLKPTDWTNTDQLNHILSVENSKLIQLFKNTRNKYFHFAQGGQKNIHNVDLKNPEFFFSCINEYFFNWISFIYATIIKETLDNTII